MSLYQMNRQKEIAATGNLAILVEFSGLICNQTGQRGLLCNKGKDLIIYS
jgi:hypothetical protein